MRTTDAVRAISEKLSGTAPPTEASTAEAIQYIADHFPAIPAPLTPAVAQADSVAGDVACLVADFNALLAKLRAAGLLAVEPEE